MHPGGNASPERHLNSCRKGTTSPVVKLSNVDLQRNSTETARYIATSQLNGFLVALTWSYNCNCNILQLNFPVRNFWGGQLQQSFLFQTWSLFLGSIFHSEVRCTSGTTLILDECPLKKTSMWVWYEQRKSPWILSPITFLSRNLSSGIFGVSHWLDMNGKKNFSETKEPHPVQHRQKWILDIMFSSRPPETNQFSETCSFSLPKNLTKKVIY